MKLTKAESAVLAKLRKAGGKARWAGTTKEQRSAAMAKVAKARAAKA